MTVETAEDVKAVHNTGEEKVCYKALRHGWQKHLPLGKKTIDLLTNFKNLFPKTFMAQWAPLMAK